MVTLGLASCQDPEKQGAAGSCRETVIFVGHLVRNMSFIVILQD